MHLKFLHWILLFAVEIAGHAQNKDDHSKRKQVLLGPEDTNVASISGAAGSSKTPAHNIITKDVGNGVQFSFHIPSIGSTDLYVQITAPASLSWVGIGQGREMRKSNMFVIYADAAGRNITLSPRLGIEHDDPMVDSTSTLSLQSGSGISAGKMTANILCSNCRFSTDGFMSYTSTTTPFVWAYKSGPSISSDSKSARLHRYSNFGNLDVDLVSASGGSSSAPFSFNDIADNRSKRSTILRRDSAGEDDAESGGVNPGLHGALGIAAFVVIFPLGAIVLRVFTFRYLLYTHVFLQLVAYALAIGTLATGIIMAKAEVNLMESHPILGIVTISVLFIQPFLGYLHHVSYKKRVAKGQSGKNGYTFPHIWWGRLWITIGIVNGALGLQLSDSSQSKIVAYAVVAGLLWLVWVACAVFSSIKARRVKGVRNSNGQESSVGLRTMTVDDTRHRK